MIKELWSTFPRLIEERINGLLDEAEPSSTKAFQLYKTCQAESLWDESFEKFSRCLGDYFSMPKRQRHKSDFDRYLKAPMKSDVFESFQLTFRNAWVDSRSLINLANWAHNLIRVSQKTESVVISTDVLTKTLQYITNPPLFEKAENIEFADFCAAWKKTVFNIFGKKHDADLEKILSELQRLDAQLKAEEASPRKEAFVPTIYLTQTEIDWTVAVQEAALQRSSIPNFPLSRGPQKQRLIDLQRTIELYRIVQTSKFPELIQHRENIRSTIIDRCATLLREKAS